MLLDACNKAIKSLETYDFLSQFPPQAWCVSASLTSDYLHMRVMLPPLLSGGLSFLRECIKAMTYPYHILKNEAVFAPAQDVETWIRHILSQSLSEVERRNLDNTGKRFRLHFKGKILQKFGKSFDLYWGGADLIDFSDGTTTIARMWPETPSDFEAGYLRATTWRSG